MTRETKVGLVVTCSFLCLVGVVLLKKLNDGGPAGNADAQADADVPIIPADPAPVADAAPTAPGMQPVTGQLALTQTPASSPVVLASASTTAAASDSGTTTRNTAPPATTTSNDGPSLSGTQTNTAPTTASPSPAPTTTNTSPAPAAKNNPFELPPSREAPPPAKEKEKAATTTPFELPPAKEKEPATTTFATKEPPAQTPPGDDRSRTRTGTIEIPPPPTPATTTDSGSRSNSDKNSPPTPAAAPKTDSPPAPVTSGPPPVPPPTADKTSSTATGSGFPLPPMPMSSDTPPPAPVPGSAAGNDPRFPAPPPMEDRTGTPNRDTPNPESRANLIQPMPMATPDVPATTGTTLEPPRPAAPVPPPVPPMGTSSLVAQGPSPSSAGPPIRPVSPAAVGAPPRQPVPQVESYDEATYRVKPGDTFESISMAYYRTDKYGPALALFNRDHPLAGTASRLDPRTVQTGQPIYVPPAGILEKRYGNAIRSEPAARPVERSSNASPAPATPVQPASPAARKYKVAGNGERMWDIARRTLGKNERWTELRALNPGYNTDYPLPAGTILTLPVDAVVDAGHTP